MWLFFCSLFSEATTGCVLKKKSVLRNLTSNILNIFHITSNFLKYEACNFIEKESLARLFSCELCKISKNTLFYRTPPVAASTLKFITNLLDTGRKLNVHKTFRRRSKLPSENSWRLLAVTYFRKKSCLMYGQFTPYIHVHLECKFYSRTEFISVKQRITTMKAALHLDKFLYNWMPIYRSITLEYGGLYFIFFRIPINNMLNNKYLWENNYHKIWSRKSQFLDYLSNCPFLKSTYWCVIITQI